MIEVAKAEDIPDNGTLALTVEGESLLLAKSMGHVFAMENRCSHALQQLAGGRVRKVHIFCPEHGVRFDMRNGCPSGNLTDKPIKVWHCAVVDGAVHVDFAKRLDDGAGGGGA